MSMKTVLVTGGSSMIGSAIVSYLRQNKDIKVLSPTHTELNLLFDKDVSNYISINEPDFILHAAGWNGGIEWNRKYPFNIYCRTVTMANNIYYAVYGENFLNLEYKPKVLGILASCSYPDTGDDILYEENLHNGLPNKTVECHGLAKRVIFDAGRQLHKETGIIATAAILTNSFGPGDSFHPEKTKVVGALIRKFVEAKQNKLASVMCWGSGSPLRQLIYSKDAGRILSDVLFKYNDPSSPINVGSPYEVSIKELTEKIARITGYNGSILWDTSKADGQMRKFISCEKLNTVIPDIQYTPLDEALAETIEWYMKNKESADAKQSGF